MTAQDSRAELAPMPAKWFLPMVVAAGVTMNVTAPIEVLYAGKFGMGSIGVGTFMLVSAVGMLLVDLLGTELFPRWNARAALILGVLLFSLGCVVMAFSYGVAPLMIGRVIQGVGSGVLLGGGMQAALRVRSNPAEGMSRFSVAMTLGTAIASPTGPLIVGAFAGDTGYRVALAGCGVLGLFTACALRAFLPPLGSDVPGPPRISLPTLGAGTAPGVLIRAMALATLGDLVRGAVLLTGLPLTGTALGVSPATISVAIGVLILFEVVSMVLIPATLARFGISACLYGALFLGLIAAALNGTATGAVGFIAAAGVFGIVMVGLTMAAALVVMAVSSDNGTGMARFRISSTAGVLIGSAGGAGIAVAFGVQSLSAVIAGVLALAAVLTFSLRKEIKAHR